MHDIKMVDLNQQYLRYKDEFDAAIQKTIDSTAFINGPEVHSFRDELSAYLDVEHVIPCANGTDALQVALMALGLEPGDEVITTPFSFIASIEVIKLLRLVPVLIDINPHTFNLDSSKLKDAISEKTRAIIPVHLFGQCADMETILEIAEPHGIKIIEDTAQAIGAEYIFKNNKRMRAGCIGDIGTTSFFPSKNLGCFGDGGAIMTRNQALHDRIKTIVNHGSRVKYYYDEVGVNSRLDTLQAAILRVKLKHLDSFHEARQKAADTYDQLLADVSQLKIPFRSSWSSHIFHQYTLRLDGGRRDELIEYLRSEKIPSMVYYPLPLHLQNAYRDLNYAVGDFPVSELMSGEVFSVPMHTELKSKQIEYICHHIKEFLNRQ